jgi:leucine dehydrogenase
MKYQQLDNDDYEEIWRAVDENAQFHSIIAIHSTKLGPSLGGVRFQSYLNEDAALNDVLRLAKTMTYKAALADLNLGGGKGVKPKGEFDRHLLFERFAEFVNHLDGRYITAKDAGTTADDVDQIRQKSEYVGGLSSKAGGAGDPSIPTAFGVCIGIREAAKFCLGEDNISGLRVVIQGLGAVGSALAELLDKEGCDLWGTDVDAKRVARCAQIGVKPLMPELVLTQDADVFSPCALGSVLNAQSIETLKASIIAGGANDPLSDVDANTRGLMKRGILYAPDFAINAGGLIHIAVERDGYDDKTAQDKLANIGVVLREIFETARDQDITTFKAAVNLAQKRLG